MKGFLTIRVADRDAYFGFKIRRACLVDRSTEGAWRAIGDAHSLFKVSVRVSTFSALFSCGDAEKAGCVSRNVYVGVVHERISHVP